MILEPVHHSDDERSDRPPTAKPVSRVRAMLVHATLVLFTLAIIARAAQIQIVEGERWARTAASQQVREEQIKPPRGRIYDANGNVLAETVEMMRVRFTPANIKSYRPRGRKGTTDTVHSRTVVRQTLKSLGVSDSWIRRALDTTRAWVEIPMEFLPSDLERLKGIPGYNPERIHSRKVTAPAGVRGILGTINSEGKAVSGLEFELDSVLQGVSGKDVQIRDGRGNRMETPSLSGFDARPGHNITLTINQSLQEIAETELMDGVKRTGATGGDVVIMDVRDGAVLAVAAVRDRRVTTTAMSLAEPYEAGSVMKPFVISRALELERVHPEQMINTENGHWRFAKRSFTDEHKAPMMSVRDVIRHSSNIGAAKIAQTLSEQEEYEALRDFGFGTATGVPYPAESRGRLPVPKWEPQTATALAIGYEISATPLQIASAYVAIANGGELLQPVLVREVRDANGTVLYTHTRRVIRRPIPEATALEMRTMLASVVDSGTAVAAGLQTYEVSGKSGTARRLVNGAYDQVHYNSTFAGMFPAESPQFVLVVRLIDPEGKIYGGTVAGRVVNVILQGAIATRDGSLDRSALALLEKRITPPKKAPLSVSAVAAAKRDTARFDSLRAPTPAAAEPVSSADRVIVSLPFTPRSKKAGAGGDGSSPDRSLRRVPSVFGLDTRQAVRVLHAAGFRVTTVKGSGGQTKPGAGTMIQGGSLVVLETGK